MGVFIFFILAGVAIFSGFIPIGQKKAAEQNPLTGTITVWGTIDTGLMQVYIDGLQGEHEGLFIQYIQKTPEAISNELANAIAAGTGPDLFFLEDNYIVQHKDKVTVIPYESYPERTFRSQYIQQAALYLSPEGVIAFPFVVDPLVLYYNRDLFNSAFIVTPPKTWEEVLSIAPRLTVKTEAGAIVQSALPLGTYANIPHAKEILSTIAIQAESPMVFQTVDGFQQGFVQTGSMGGLSAALRYYATFATPTQPNYSWSANLRNARDAFIAEEAAMYIGYASELSTIRNQNPNLNFDVSLLPQLDTQNLKFTSSRMFALAISKQSTNVAGAYQLANILTSPNYVYEFSQGMMLPPVRQEVLATTPTDPYMQVFYNSAIISRSWWDPQPTQTESIFKTMIEETLSGISNADDAVERAASRVEQLLLSR